MAKRLTEVQHVDDPAAVGRRLREARERAGLSQRALSFAGCSPAYLSRIESGDRRPSLQLLRELARRLGVTERYLAYGEEEEETDPLLEAELALRMGDRELAEKLYRNELDSDEKRRRAAALEGLGQLAFGEGEVHQAIELLEEARTLWGAAALRRRGLVDTMGRAYSFTGEAEAAIALLEQALAAAEEEEDLVDATLVRILLSAALSDIGEIDSAEQVLAEALKQADELADPQARVRLYWAQCRLHVLKERPEVAERYARKVLSILEQTEDEYNLARGYRLMAHIELDRRRPQEALELLGRSRAVMGTELNDVEDAMIRINEARALAQLGELEEAASNAMEVSGTLADRPEEAGQAYAVLGGTFAEMGDRTRAIELLELACELLEQTPSRYLVQAYAQLAELLEAEGRKDDAFDVMKKAVRVQAKVGSVPTER